jgi:hypothetical protein
MSVARIETFASATLPVPSRVMASEYGSSPEEQADDHRRIRGERVRNSSRIPPANALSCACSRKK